MRRHARSLAYGVVIFHSVLLGVPFDASWTGATAILMRQAFLARRAFRALIAQSALVGVGEKGRSVQAASLPVLARVGMTFISGLGDQDLPE